jgi:hypothetical protein
MNKQKTFTDMEYAQRKRTVKRKKFPDAVIHRAAFEKTIMPFYTKSGSRKGQGLCRGCISRESGSIRRTGKNIYGSRAMGKFTRPDYFREDAPDAAPCRISGIRMESMTRERNCFGLLTVYRKRMGR